MIRISADSTLHGYLLWKALSYKSAEDEDEGMFIQRQKHSMKWYHSSAKWDGKENANCSDQVIAEAPEKHYRKKCNRFFSFSFFSF